MKNVAKKKKGAITYPKGFSAAGVYSGIKKKKENDLSLIISHVPAVAAASFTTNKVTAWPVQYSKKSILNKTHRAILANSGNANCMNGPKGKEGTDASVAFLARSLGITSKEILVASTGIIGRELPVENICTSIPELCMAVSKSGGHDAAKGILTTDTLTKEVAAECVIGGKKVRVGAIAKGSGMLHPHIATMLVFITTDVSIRKMLLKKLVQDVVSLTFNCLSIDNDMSTNDTVFVLANGQAGNKTIVKKDKTYLKFAKALLAVCKQLTLLLAEDGEGVQHVCELTVCGAKNKLQAKKVAQQIANSMLFKTALAGEDPNWGRIIAALGSVSGVSFRLDHVDLLFGTIAVIKNGNIRKVPASTIKKVMTKKRVPITLDLKSGAARCEFVTTDLTKEYVQINSEYTT